MHDDQASTKVNYKRDKVYGGCNGYAVDSIGILVRVIEKLYGDRKGTYQA